jgi:ureidoglycolate lyase
VSIRLPARPLTRAAFEPFGEIIDIAGRSPETINAGHTRKWGDLASIDTLAEGGRTALHRYRSEPVRQGFVPLHGQPFLVVVAPAGAEPGPEAIRAFLTDGRQGVNYHRGTWHHYQLTLDQPGDYLVIDRAGPGLNLDEYRLAQPLIIDRAEAS